MLDHVTIEFDPASLILLNLIMAVMMFGVSLGLKVSDFTAVLKAPKAPITGLVAQFVLLPAMTFGLILALQPDPGLALGMMLVAACPGGNFSNLMTFLARGNVATSVSMTAVSSTAALVLTPLNFLLYANAYAPTQALVTSFAIDPLQVLGLMLLVLGVPLVLGMWTGARWPQLLPRIERPFRVVSLLIFLAFVGIAFGANFELFTQYFHRFVGYVVLQNGLALTVGFALATLMAQSRGDRRAVTLEVGIQNSGLALVILFTFMPNQGGAILIAAFWGVWHLVTGIALSTFWSRRPIPFDSEESHP